MRIVGIRSLLIVGSMAVTLAGVPQAAALPESSGPGGTKDLGGGQDSGKAPWLVRSEASTTGTAASYWAKMTSGNGYSVAGLTKEGASGSLVLSGFSNNYGIRGLDFWLFNVDGNGNPSGSTLYGGADTNNNLGHATPTSDGGYIAVGSTDNGAATTGYWILKLDSGGSIAWQKSIPSELSLTPVVTTLTDGYVFSGTYLDLTLFTVETVLLKLDLSGNVVWIKAYTAGETAYLDAFQVVGLANGHIVLNGSVTNTDTLDPDLLLMELDADGTPVWANSYGGSSPDAPTLLAPISGGYLLQGSTLSYGSGGSTTGDVWLLKVDQTGGIDWQKAYGGANDEFGIAAVDPAGGYIMSASTTSFGAGQKDVWLVKLDDSGDIVWQKTYGGTGNETGYAEPESGGGYFLSSQTDSFGHGNQDVWLAELDANGGVVWQKTYGTSNDDVGGGARLASGEILVMGQNSDPLQPTHTDENVFVVRAQTGGDLGFTCSFIQPGTGVAATGTGAVTTTTATAVPVTVDVSTPPIVVSDGSFVAVPSSLTLTDICSQTGGCTTDQDCNDNEVCTFDTCESSTCFHTPEPGPCDDGNPCTINDQCAGGTCSFSLPNPCNDQEQCTTDSCDPGVPGGCVHTNNTDPCDDINACTTGDVCSNGQCQGTGTLTCDDGDPCTTDACAPATGCSHAPTVCDDGDPCTVDACVPGTGCVFTPLGCGPLEFLYPNGGEILATGSNVALEWQAPETTASVDLKYSLDNGSSWKSIASRVGGRTYAWTVPTQGGNKNKVRFKVVGRTASGAKAGADKSDAPSTIEVIRLDQPNGGETFGSGEQVSVEWTTNATKRPVTKVKLKYTVNNGNKWQNIAVVEGNPGFYLWTIPTLPSTKTKCLVKVLLLDSAGNKVGNDNSDAFFTIEP